SESVFVQGKPRAMLEWVKEKGRDTRSYESPGRARGVRRKREGAAQRGRAKCRWQRLKCPLRGAARSSVCGRIGATEGGVISVVGEVVELSTPHLSSPMRPRLLTSPQIPLSAAARQRGSCRRSRRGSARTPAPAAGTCRRPARPPHRAIARAPG